MRFFYSDTFDIPLPPKHRFPGAKYSALRKTLITDGTVSEDQLLESPLADMDPILKVHDREYVQQFIGGTLPEQKMKRIGFPWSEHLVKRIFATMGGAMAASREALKEGLSGQLAGGTHHAHFDYGLGYCIFNDFAITAKDLLENQLVDRVAIVDLDVHQGDGNATLLAEDDRVFVFSMHGEKNFPFKKFESDLDIALPDQCDDALYIHKLHDGLDEVSAFKPDIVLYQAGVDVLKQDKLGRLNISYDGLNQRDSLVFQTFKQQGIPISMAIGGGYSDPIDFSVKAYSQTYQVAKSIYGF